MPKPNRTSVTTPADNAAVLHGRDLTVAVDGDSSDPNNGQQTSLMVRVFYRIKGVPFAAVVYNGRAIDQAHPNKHFNNDAAQTLPFRVTARTVHTVRAIAWDNKGAQKPANGTDHRTKITRFSVLDPVVVQP